MISVEAWRAGGRFFSWRGEQVFCRVQGQGMPLLLIHGFPTSSWDYWPLWEHLAARYRVLTLGVGHYPQLEAPAEVLRAVEEFLARTS